ncbi:class IV adenylate cyclase [bacterium]|nr:class IV adenylate cyclase [bacterium]
MARNIEIKASLDNVGFCLDKAKSLAGSDPEIIEQEDFFFKCDNGRLKLRFFSRQNGVLIFYQRKNDSGPKTSEYFLSETNEPEQLLQVLEKAYGLHGRVKKIRKLFLIGRTRVHIDQVESLGDFLELEVVLSENEDGETGKAEAYHLMEQFRIGNDKLIDCAYVDLINARN